MFDKILFYARFSESIISRVSSHNKMIRTCTFEKVVSVEQVGESGVVYLLHISATS